MKADQGEVMVDPSGPWWFWVYLVYAVVLGGAYGLCIAGLSLRLAPAAGHACS